MTEPKLTALIDKRDNAEIIRDEIAAILALESLGQQALALEADKDPDLWKLRIFTERTNPWQEFTSSPPKGQILDVSPLVNVSWDSSKDDESKSDSVERQHVVGVYHLDCYGYGISADSEDGHDAGDEVAALEAQRAARLVRNILRSAKYRQLGMTGTVANVWRESAQAVQPVFDQRAVQHVSAVRIALRVTFNEFSPQVEGTPLALIQLTAKRTETGEIVFEGSYPQEQS